MLVCVMRRIVVDGGGGSGGGDEWRKSGLVSRDLGALFYVLVVAEEGNKTSFICTTAVVVIEGER